MKTIIEASFEELIGEKPIDVLGSDWENTIRDYMEENFECCEHCGSWSPGVSACYYCKMD